MTWANLLLLPALPELWLSFSTLTLLLLGVCGLGGQNHNLYRLSLIILVINTVLEWWVLQHYPTPIYLFSQMFVVDTFSTSLKLLMSLTTIIVLVYSQSYMVTRRLLHNEYLVLSLFALLGMQVMASATHLLVAYIGLEMVSLALYALIALQRVHRAIEAAIKYFVLGALASGFLLYGISMLYGATYTLMLHEILQCVRTLSYEPTLLVLGIVFIVCGLAFKLGAAPFHMWVPDIYQGAPLSITLLISAAPKLAVVGFVLRLWVALFNDLTIDWQLILIVLAVLSMTLGNIVAIAQTNVKRMLAYSTIAHMGFLLLGLIGRTPASYGATYFYMTTYVLMSLGAFGVLLTLSTAKCECETLDDLKGLNQRNSWYALLLLLTLFSMAGTPPMVGFYAKWNVIQAVVGLHLPNLSLDLTWLAVYAVMMSLIGAFYYLRVVKCMYMDDALDTSPIPRRTGMVWLLSFNTLALLLLGLFPDTFLRFCFTMVQHNYLAM